MTHGKTKAARRLLPMTPRVRHILETRWNTQGRPVEGYVWPTPTNSGHIEPSSLKKQHTKALKLSKVRPFVLYSLRHTFLTRLGQSGCDVWTLGKDRATQFDCDIGTVRAPVRRCCAYRDGAARWAQFWAQ